MTDTPGEAEILVIGAGIVGLATAWTLHRRGHGVVLIDPGPPGGEASSGNAATLADYAVAPLATPTLLADLPRLLFSPASPFHLRWRHLPRLSPWLGRFLLAARRAPREAAGRTLCQLLTSAIEDWQALHESLPPAPQAPRLIHRGALYFFREARHWRAARAEVEAQERLGLEPDYLDAQGVAALEPALAGVARGGILYPSAAHVDDPRALARRLAGTLATEGVRCVPARATGLTRVAGRIRVTTDRGAWRADRVVIAAGAWSAGLARQAGDRIPLEVERGYHLEFPEAATRLSRPCCPAENAFYMTPLDGRLRLAGTVELGHPDDPPNPSRLAYLRRHGEALLGPLGPVGGEWLGLRPSLPDSLPVVGPASLPGVVYAFGHGHLGLTLAATTGRLVAEELAGSAPAWMAACHPGRFG